MRIEELHPYLLIMSQLCYCYINPHYSLNQRFNTQIAPFAQYIMNPFPSKLFAAAKSYTSK